MDRNKKIIVGLIFAMTSLLAGLSVYVSWELRRDISPDDTAADVGVTPSTYPSFVEPTKIDKKKKTPTKVPTKTPTKIPTVIPTAGPTQAGGVVPTTAGGGAGQVATPVPSAPLPQTALINNRVDTAIIASLLVISGLFLYKNYFNFGSKNKQGY